LYKKIIFIRNLIYDFFSRTNVNILFNEIKELDAAINYRFIAASSWLIQMNV